MIRLLSLSAVALLCFTSLALAQERAKETQFFESLYDVPVMAQLEEIPDMALSFDKPNGRIAYAGADSSSALTQGEIIAFYAQSLPQMGWVALNKHEYRRENEMLRISIINNAGGVQGRELVQFMLFPVQDASNK